MLSGSPAQLSVGSPLASSVAPSVYLAEVEEGGGQHPDLELTSVTCALYRYPKTPPALKAALASLGHPVVLLCRAELRLCGCDPE